MLLLSFVFDCVDGQLARYTLNFPPAGAWLDAMFDRVKEYTFYAGLAVGAARTGDDVWGLALAAMALQTFRHVAGFCFTRANLAEPGNPATRSSGRRHRAAWAKWARRIVALPIAERWALIALFTAVTTLRTTFVVLIAAMCLSCGIMTRPVLQFSRPGALHRPGRPRPAVSH